MYSGWNISRVLAYYHFKVIPWGPKWDLGPRQAFLKDCNRFLVHPRSTEVVRGEDTSTTIPWVYTNQTLQIENKNVLFNAPMEVLSTLKIHTHSFKKIEMSSSNILQNESISSLGVYRSSPNIFHKL